MLKVAGVDRVRSLRVSLARSANLGDTLARCAWPHLEALEFGENVKWGKLAPPEVLASMPSLKSLAVPVNREQLRGWAGLRTLRALTTHYVPEAFLEIDGGHLESIGAWDLDFDATLPTVRRVSVGKPGSWTARSFERFPGLTSLTVQPKAPGETSAEALRAELSEARCWDRAPRGA